MAQAIVYLNFNGNCAEAMKFYQKALGGDLELNPIGSSPMAEHMPKENPNNILHSALTSNGILIMASDMVHGQLAENGTGYNICLNCDSEDQLKDYYDKLVAGGNAIERPAAAPWGGIFAMLTDKFGKAWMFNYTLR